MQTITTIGLDTAKSVFQVQGVDAGGQVVIRRQLKRRYRRLAALVRCVPHFVILSARNKCAVLPRTTRGASLRLPRRCRVLQIRVFWNASQGCRVPLYPTASVETQADGPR